MAKRKPLVFVAGEIVESKISDTIDGNNISVTTAGTPTERLLKDRFNDIINVKDYGAKGNGITDDTAAFQAAALAAEDKHGVVYIPAGIYKIADDINGEFITFGHVGFVGEGTLTQLTDLYDDYVHKTGNINETVTGDKNFTGTTTIELGNIHTKQFSGTTVSSSDGNCNLANGNVFEINASTANKTITFTNVPVGNSIIGLIINKGENKTISWPENIQWAFDSEPELLVGYNYIYLMTPNDGTNWYGFSVTQPIDPEELLANISTIQLKNKGGLAQDSNGIYINTKNNGGLGIDNNNQVYVDFSKITTSDILDEVNEILAQLGSDGLDEATVKAIVTSMLLNTGGLAVDNNGKLYVKLKNPGGLAKDANGLYINLASGGGLEFNSNNQLKVKISDLDFGTGSPIDLATLADGVTIKVVNNKLTVDSASLAALLADGITITENNGKLSANNTGNGTVTVSSLVDNITTVVDPNNKIAVDLTSVTPTALENISEPLITSGSGLIIDTNTKKISTWFIPLTSDLQLYVDGTNGSDTLVPNRGTETLPFKTIQACVNYAITHYVLLGSSVANCANIHINIVPGAYNERVQLTSFFTNCSFISLRKNPTSNQNLNVQITNGISCTGGFWQLVDLQISKTIDEAVPSSAAISATGETTDLYCFGCDVSISYTGPSSNSIQPEMNVFIATGQSSISISGGQDSLGGTSSAQCTKGNASTAYIYHAVGSSITAADNTINGTVTATAFAENRGRITGLSLHPISGTVTGKKYIITNNSYIIAPPNGFPGSQAGDTPEAATYCWYKEYT